MGLETILEITIPLGYIISSIITYIILVPTMYRDEYEDNRCCSCGHCKKVRKNLKDHTKEHIRFMSARYHGNRIAIACGIAWPLMIVLALGYAISSIISKGIFRQLKKFAFRSIDREETKREILHRLNEDVKAEELK